MLPLRAVSQMIGLAMSVPLANAVRNEVLVVTPSPNYMMRAHACTASSEAQTSTVKSVSPANRLAGMLM